MKNNVSLALSCLLATSLITACSDSDSDSKSASVVQQKGDVRSCEYGIYEGEPANSSLASDQVGEASFGKRYPRSKYLAIASASIYETIRYITWNTGAQVYKAANLADLSCWQPNMQSAQELPSDLYAEWNRVNDKGGTGSVVGLYLPKGRLPSTKTMAAVIVRENASRSTLVHEYLHHLFYTQAALDGYNDDEAITQVEKDADALRTLRASTDSASFDQFHQTIIRFVENFDQVLVHRTLEEVTVEKMMANDLESKTLRFLPKDSFWYLISSAKAAKERYQAFQATLLSVCPDSNCGKDPYGYVKAHHTIQKRLAEIEKILAEFPSYEWDRARMSVSDRDQETHGSGCSHQHDEVVEKLFQKFLEI